MTDWYSTPFRKYDPSLGRFHGVDALAELYPGITPSHFGANNPVNFNDPTGLETQPGDPENGGDGGAGSGIMAWLRQSEFAMYGYERISSAERGHGGSNTGMSGTAGSGFHWSDYYRSPTDPMWTTSGLAVAYGNVEFYNGVCDCMVNAIEFLRFGEQNGYQNLTLRSKAEQALQQAREDRMLSREYQVVLYSPEGRLGDPVFHNTSDPEGRSELVEVDGLFDWIYALPGAFVNKPTKDFDTGPSNKEFWADIWEEMLSHLAGVVLEVNPNTNSEVPSSEEQIVETATEANKVFIESTPWFSVNTSRLGVDSTFQVNDSTTVVESWLTRDATGTIMNVRID